MADNVIVRVPEQQFIRGEDGYSPEVTIENIEHGHSVTITDREHQEEGQTFNVLDGDSAYEQAVAGGYTGTEAQFNEELASFKELSEQAADSANTAAGAAFRAQNYERHAGDAEDAARAYADIALIRMNSADQSAQSAAGSASNASRDAGTASTAATTATTKAGEASDSATAADGSAKDSEAYAIGKRGGTDVGSADPAYHNNAKYYAEQAALIVDDVEQVMTPTTIGPTALATFDASVAGMPLKGLTVGIEPVQAEGTPSPENPLPITGWTGCNIYHSGEDMSNPTTYSITFPSEAGTVYGGTLDVVNGVLKVTHAITTVSAKTWRYDSDYTRFNAGFAGMVSGKYGVRAVPFMCSAFQPIDDGRSLANVPNNSIYGAGTSATVFIKTDTVSTVEDFISTYGNAQILYELAEPRVYDIADIPNVLTLLGENNIWADTGNVTVTYGAYLETVKAYADQAEDAQEAAEQAQAAAEAVLESIPSDYTELSEDVDDLKSVVTKTVSGNPVDFVNKYITWDGKEAGSSKLAVTKRYFNYMQDGLLTVEVAEPYVFYAYGWKRATCLSYIGNTGWNSGGAKLLTKLNLSEYPDVSFKFGLRHVVNGTAVDVTTEEAVNFTFTFRQNSFLANRKISVMGDSISSFDGYTSPNSQAGYYPRETARLYYADNMYWKCLADRNGMVIDTIDAFAGSTVADKWQTAVRIPFYDDSRVNRLGEPDIIIVEGGINDFGGNPLGDYPALGDYSKTYEFRTAYSLLLNKLKTKYINSTIVCLSMTSPRTYNNTTFPEKQTEVIQALATDTTPHAFAEFNESIEHIAKQYQCAYCDITDLLDYYLNPTSTLGPHWYFNLHMEVAYRIEQLLKQIYA